MQELSLAVFQKMEKSSIRMLGMILQERTERLRESSVERIDLLESKTSLSFT